MTEGIDYAGMAEKSIKELVSEFKRNPYNFLSESDVKCRLFIMLFQKCNLSELKRTIDGRLISPLHSEVTYFNDNGQLLFHVDLSAFEPEQTNVYSTPKSEGVRFSKGYRAGMCYFAIELKLNKTNNRQKMLETWEKDIRKLSDILRRNPSLACFSILLDKRNNINAENELSSMQFNYPHIRMIYASASGSDFFL